MPAQTTNLFLLQDLEDSSRTRKPADSDLNALHTVADWIKTFVARPNKDLGRAGPVCPFVHGAWERKTLWLAPEQIANHSVPDVVQLVNDYKGLLLRAQPTEGDDANYKAIVVCFHRFVGGSCKRLCRRRPNTASERTLLCGRWSGLGRVPRKERGVCDLQPELSTVQSTRAVFC